MSETTEKLKEIYNALVDYGDHGDIREAGEIIYDMKEDIANLIKQATEGAGDE